MKTEKGTVEKFGSRTLQGALLLGWLGVWAAGVPVATAQWVSNGPYGGFIHSIAIDPQTPATVYAGTSGGGVFKSRNGGGSWTAVNSGLTNSDVLALAIDPQTPSTLYAGTNGGGVFKSADGGGTWTVINTSPNVETLAVDPQTPQTVYVGTAGSGLLKSSDGGASWASAGLLDLIIQAIAIDPKTSSTVYAGTVEGVFKSTDGGGSWTAVNSGLTYLAHPDVQAIAIDPQTPATVYAGTNGGGVFKSTNSGETWTSVGTGLVSQFVSVVAIDPQTPATIYAGTFGGGVSKSTTGGGSWSAINTDLANLEIRTFAIDSQASTKLYCGTWGGGISKSSDGGGSWTAANSGVTNSTVLALAIDPRTTSTVYGGTLSSGVFKSAIGGGNWAPAISGVANSDVYALAIDPQTRSTLYAGTRGEGVFKSTNGGSNWDVVNTGLSNLFVSALAIDPLSPSTLYAGTGGGVYKSANGGQSWTAVNTDLTDSSVKALAIDLQTPSTLYAGTDGGGMFKSTNGGGNWDEINSGLTNNRVLTIAIDPQTPAKIYVGTRRGVFRSSNGGGTWTGINTGLTSNRILALVIDPEAPSTLYAGTDGGGIFKSTNGGQSWTTFNDGLTSSVIQALAIDPEDSSRVYAGSSGGGVFVYQGTACSYSISPTTRSYSSFGTARDQVGVTAANGCLWTAGTDQPWITITAGSNGNGNGAVTFSVSPYAGTGSRMGTITIANQVFTLTQTGPIPTFFITSITPNSGSVSGGTEVTITGSGFQTGASVSIGGIQVTVSNVTASQITATTGIASTPGIYDVVVTNPGGEFAELENAFTYTAAPTAQELEVFVPVVLSAEGLNGSFFTSELTLTNRGLRNASLDFDYTSAFGGGSGHGIDSLAAGQQKIVPDAIAYLKSLGIPIPETGNRGGTLRVRVSGVESGWDFAVTVRTTTPFAEGRIGLAYSGARRSAAFTGVVYLCGLRQNATDRSNVAVQNSGSAEEGDIVLRLTVYSADPLVAPRVHPDITLSPGEFSQISGILGLYDFSGGYVKVEKVSGDSSYYAYAVINDQGTSDGSFVPPLLADSLTGVSGLTLPVIVETGTFSSELALVNFSTTSKTLRLAFVSDNIQTADSTARFNVTLDSGQQIILANLVQWLRTQGTEGIGPAGPTYAGALFASVEGGDCSGIFMGARTATPDGNGYYGLFYTAVPFGQASTTDTWLYGLQQNAENRTNLAMVNTGEAGGDTNVFNIELYDGVTGQLAATVRDVTLPAKGWKQINGILAQYAPQVTEGYAHIVRTSGQNPFIAYAVINDGAAPGERTGDGAFIASSP